MDYTKRAEQNRHVLISQGIILKCAEQKKHILVATDQHDGLSESLSEGLLEGLIETDTPVQYLLFSWHPPVL